MIHILKLSERKPEMKQLICLTLAGMAAILVLSQETSAAECLPQDQLTEDDKYVGKLKDECVISIQRNGNYSIAELNHIIVVYGSSLTGRGASAKRATQRPDENKLGLSEEDLTINLLLGFEDAWHISDLVAADAIALEIIESLVSDEKNYDVSGSFVLGKRGNRYKRGFEDAISSMSAMAAVNFYDGYLYDDGSTALPEDKPTDEERLFATEQLKYYYHRLRKESRDISLFSWSLLNPAAQKFIDDLKNNKTIIDSILEQDTP